MTSEPERDQGGSDAVRRWVPLVYDDLRGLAASYLGPRGRGTLQPTALVHEAYLRLAEAKDPRLPKDREHLFAILALAMRQALAEHVRAQRAAKRGGALHRTTLQDEHGTLGGRPIDLFDLDDALAELAVLDPRDHDVAVLRYLGNLTIEETAGVLRLGLTAVKDAWKAAKAWLMRRLRDAEASR